MGKPFRCRLGWHKWARRFNPEGVRYSQCDRCGTDDGRAKIHWSAGGPG
jgi:hypothetical protein